MGPLIIAAVVAHVITKAWEESKARSAARWESARTAAADRQAAAAARRTARLKARRRRLFRAGAAGPSDPLWWLVAAGWSIGALALGSVAAVAGAREGAAYGAAKGYRIGQERAWARQARRRREAAAFRNGRKAGREAGRDEAERAHPEWRPAPEDEVATGQCPRCGAYMATPETCPCPTPAPLTATGEPTPPPAAEEEPARTRTAGRETDTRGWEASYRAAHGGASYRRPEWGPAFVPGDLPPKDHVVDGEVVDDPPKPTTADDDVIDGEVVYDPNETTPSITNTTTAIERTTPMALTSGDISGGDGEGYSTTISALERIASLLAELNGVVSDLGDTLTSRNVDSTTTGYISELDDHLQAATNIAEQAGQHAQDKHEPVATAIAGAGGSGEVADTDWYDHV